MQRHYEFQRQCPPPVDVGSGEEQAALHEEQEHVEEADEVTAGVLHRVVPEGVDGRPAEEVAVVAAQEIGDALGDRHRGGRGTGRVAGFP